MDCAFEIHEFLEFVLPDFICFFSILFSSIGYWLFTLCIYLCTVHIVLCF